MDIKEKIEELRAELHRHNYNYYVLNAPEISDKEFDDKMRELQDLELAHPEYKDENSPTMRVGSDINKNFTQVAHKYPMLSLANTYSEGEVTDFYERVRKALNEDFEICCEMKYDGTSISLTYEDGKLVRAVTRGDGEKGDDVTDNVKTIRSIPLVLHGDNYPSSFEIRGEILMPWEVFEELNREKEAREEPLFANPRNAASGTLKLQNSSIHDVRNGEREKEGKMIPVWDFLGSVSVEYLKEGKSVGKETYSQPDLSLMTINAMDGSVMERRDMGK